MRNNFDKCLWIDWRNKVKTDFYSKRIYFGNETCEKLLPDFEDLVPIINLAKLKNIQLTFVTPFLSEHGINKVIGLLEKLQDAIENFEIVISDWGLLDWVCKNKIGSPVISRFLVGQQLDFRLSALFSDELVKDKLILMNDSYHRLKQKFISSELKEHLTSCSLLNTKIIEYFNTLGIYRFEINNIFQNINLYNDGKAFYSLHVPFVPVALMRWCPNKNMDFNFVNIDCGKQNCNNNFSEWHISDSSTDIFLINNGVYYFNDEWESKISKNTNIDRIVFSLTK